MLGDSLGILWGLPKDLLGIPQDFARDAIGFLRDSLGLPQDRDSLRVPLALWVRNSLRNRGEVQENLEEVLWNPWQIPWNP